MVLEREMYDLTNEELCELWCGQPEQDYDEESEYEDNNKEE